MLHEAVTRGMRDVDCLATAALREADRRKKGSSSAMSSPASSTPIKSPELPDGRLNRRPHGRPPAGHPRRSPRSPSTMLSPSSSFSIPRSPTMTAWPVYRASLGRRPPRLRNARPPTRPPPRWRGRRRRCTPPRPPAHHPDAFAASPSLAIVQLAREPISQPARQHTVMRHRAGSPAAVSGEKDVGPGLANGALCGPGPPYPTVLLQCVLGGGHGGEGCPPPRLSDPIGT